MLKTLYHKIIISPEAEARVANELAERIEEFRSSYGFHGSERRVSRLLVEIRYTKEQDKHTYKGIIDDIKIDANELSFDLGRRTFPLQKTVEVARNLWHYLEREYIEITIGES